MGPQHPSTHGVLRLVLDLEGETVTKARVVIGYLHTGIEKNTEYRNWTQGTTFVTRMDYLSPLFNEAGYCMAVEKLLGIEAPQRAQTIRVLVMELNRIASHLVGPGHRSAWRWAPSPGMTNGFREREMVLDLLEEITGLRMNHAYIRPGGLAQDLPEGAVEQHPRVPRRSCPKRMADYPPDAHRPADLAEPAQGRRLPRRHRLPRPRRHRARPALGRPAVGPAQGRAVPAATRPTTSRCRPPTPATRGAATWSAWPR